MGQDVLGCSFDFHTDSAFPNSMSCQEKKRLKGLFLFNLATDCTEKELESAYRRLAKAMHPDKNGGTEEAKEQFQVMRASYEEHKKVGCFAFTFRYMIMIIY